MRDGDLALLGLAMRAGAVIVGTTGVRLALRRDNVRLVMVAGFTALLLPQQLVIIPLQITRLILLVVGFTVLLLLPQQLAIIPLQATQLMGMVAGFFVILLPQ